ncbi:hypothetical protein [Opitutus terrae]|uniref:Uncharacterized protein n=1 Tax=Opitutus terrae (strain DSM 11246 / JCM 15787 / PB90-1) TaxID=452637 RepID=B1ZYP3_OPITP|nr:hypothetical protein [Opitutus terrae]ACB75279.1 hypothetical protein Oter_1996 [Opitutus terrae PB90-1]
MTLHFGRSLVAACLLAGLVRCATAAITDSRLVNLSTRGFVGTGDDVLIAGFVVNGTGSKEVLIRAVGPSLAQAGLAGALTQPRLQVFDSTGRLIATQERWDPTLKPVFAQIGASPFAENSLDAALRLTLAAGHYTVHVSGIDGPRGIALVEVYEINGAPRLLNLSTRGRIESGDGVLIAGLVISGQGPRRVLLRAGGPALTKAGLNTVVPDPVLTLFDQQGRVVASNDDWCDSDYSTEVAMASSVTGAYAFPDASYDSALLIDLPPGAYSMHVSGLENRCGIALLEVYDVTAATGATATSMNSAAVKAEGASSRRKNPKPAPDPNSRIGTPYSASALSWARADVSARLGPTFAELNPGAADDRPTLFKQESKIAGGKYYVRINPYELGEPGTYNDYWSDTGQVGYIPNDPANDPGLDRVQVYAYYNRVFAISPRPDVASGRLHSDPQTREPRYLELNGGTPMQPVAMVRSYGMQQNEQLVIYRDGLFAVAGMQTSRGGDEKPYPGFKFPQHKVPRGIAVTTSLEFALVTIWDTERRQGQLAVVALEGKFLPFHTWPYMGLPNQGSFSDFKLLGYIDLPMKSPEAVAAASNGLWRGPSSTDGRVLSEIDLATDGHRKLVYDGAWQAVVAKSGYALVSSTEDNKIAVVDLTPLFSYMRESYLSSGDSFRRTLAERGAAPTQFPQTFEVNPAIKPKVIWETPVSEPTAVLAGQKIDRWTKDRFKAYVASRDGTVRILDVSPLMARSSWETRGQLEIMGQFQVGRNPVAMALSRHGAKDLPLIPNGSDGAQLAPDPFNNLFYVACRGERSIDAVVTWQGQGQVYRRIKDARMGDPVAVSVAIRGNIVSVADFAGQKLLSFRMGTLNDAKNDKVYPPGDPRYPYEFAGEMKLLGSPFLVNSANTN